MKTEHKTYNEYWEEIQSLFGYKDTITLVNNENGDEVVEFRNSCGCLLSRYNIDKEIAEYE